MTNRNIAFKVDGFTYGDHVLYSNPEGYEYPGRLYVWRTEQTVHHPTTGRPLTDSHVGGFFFPDHPIPEHPVPEKLIRYEFSGTEEEMSSWSTVFRHLPEPA